MDTGSHLSTISARDVDRLNVKISPTRKKAKGYGDGIVNFLGKVCLTFKFKNKSFPHTFLVVEKNHISLLGRDLFNKLGAQIVFPDSDDISVNHIDNNILHKYKNFLSDDFKSNVKTKVKLRVDPDKQPIFCKSRPTPLRYRTLVKEELDRLASCGIATKVFRSEWACPAVNILKSSGKIRICGDYSLTVNKAMTTVQYPLPSIEDVLGKVSNAKVFSKIDLQNAFLQIPLDDDSKPFTTINTSEGLYSFNYLPFGIASSPGIFQSYLCQVLSDIEHIVIYQDDVLIMTSDTSEHDIILDKVLSALMNAGIKLNVKKCAFYVDSVKYLGYIFDKQGVKPDPEKIRAIIDAPSPVNVSQVQSFIGLCNFYNRFIKNFSEVFAPLYSLLKKNAKFQWSAEQEQCFTLVKNLFKSKKVLRLFDSKLESALETDASSGGIGAVLMQLHSDGWYPVQFASRTLNPAEQNYSQIEREALSVIFGCERFRQFLLGSKFLIKNDHKPLLKLFAHDSGVPLNCSARLQRWKLRLSQFQYVFQFIKGSDNVNSDFLSRVPLNEINKNSEPYELIFLTEYLDKMPVNCSDIKSATDKDKNLCELKQYIKSGFPCIVPSALSCFKNLSGELSIVKGCIMYRNRVFVPETLRSPVLKQFHEGHPGISGMKSLCRSLIWFPGIDNDITDLVKKCKQCQVLLPKPSQNRSVEWPQSFRKWSRLHIDHFFYQNNVFLVVIDSLTKYIECEIVKNTSAIETINTLRCIFSRNGLPDTIVSDNATSFTAVEFKDFLLLNGINHLTPAPYTPSSNGQAERAVRVIKDLLKKNVSGSLQSPLSNVLLHYRNVPHSITKIAPSVSLNGRTYVTIRERINPNFVPSIKKDPKNIPVFQVGESVLALNLREGHKWLRATVLEQLAINLYSVLIVDYDVVWKRHIHQLLRAPDACVAPHDTSSLGVTNNSLSAPVEPTFIDNFPQIFSPVTDSNVNDNPSNSNVGVVSSSSITVPVPVPNAATVKTPPEPLRRSERIRKPVVPYTA